MRIWDVDLGEVRQTDGFTCGPTSAMIAGAMLDPTYASALDITPAGFAREQRRIHQDSNRIWPRKLGTTPWGVAAAISRHSVGLGVRYGWRVFRGHGDGLTDVLAAVDTGWPVALLIGRVVPRHWVLLTEQPAPAALRVYNPATGRSRTITVAEIQSRTVPLGFPRAFALVLPVAVVSG